MEERKCTKTSRRPSVAFPVPTPAAHLAASICPVHLLPPVAAAAARQAVTRRSLLSAKVLAQIQSRLVSHRAAPRSGRTGRACSQDKCSIMPLLADLQARAARPTGTRHVRTGMVGVQGRRGLNNHNSVP